MAIPGHIKRTVTARLKDQSRGNTPFRAWRTATPIAEGYILPTQCRCNQPLRRGMHRIEDGHPMKFPPICEPGPASRWIGGREKFLRMAGARLEREYR